MKSIRAILIFFCTMLLLTASESLHAGNGSCFSVTDPGPHYVSSGSICLSGPVDNFDHLVDFTVSIEMPDQVGVVQLVDAIGFDTIKPNGAAGGSFQFNLPLSVDGTYTIHVNTLHYMADQNTLSYPPSSMVVTVVKLPPFDFKPTAVGNGATSIPIPQGTPDDSDGDGICNGSVAVPPSPANGNKGCTAGPDTIIDYQVPAETGIVSNPASKICIQPTQGASGENLEVSTINTITDTDGFVPPRVITLPEGPNKVTKGTDAVFCPGGFVVSLTKIAHGINQVQITLKQVTGDGEVKTQSFDVIFKVDLQGPHFCASYFSGDKAVATSGHETPVILASEVNGSLTVKVDIKACGAQSTEDLLAAQQPEDLVSCPYDLCAVVNGKKVKKQIDSGKVWVDDWKKVTGGNGQYQFNIDPEELRFPLNFMELVGKDSHGNETRQTLSFGFGEVRHPFNSNGDLNISKGTVSQVLAGFLPEKYLNGGLKDDLEHFLDSTEFKLNIFPKIFNVEKPSPEEANQCGGKQPWEGSRIFEETSLVTFLHVPKKGEPGYKAELDEINKMKVTIHSLQLLNGDSFIVDLKIKDFIRKAEIFTVKFDENEAKSPTNVDKLPGNILQFGSQVSDNTLGIAVLPIKFNIKELDLYLKVHFFKDGKGDLQLSIETAPYAPDGKPVKAIGYDWNDWNLISFDCEGDKTFVHDTNGEPLDKNNAKCQFLENQNAEINQNDFEPSKFNQTIDQRFLNILTATVTCNLPFKMGRQLDKYTQDAVTQMQLELFGKRLFLDFFAPLRQADVDVKTWGFSFAGSGFLMPAGFEDIEGSEVCTEEGDDVPYQDKKCNAYQYANKGISEDLRKDHRFGVIYEPSNLSNDLVVAPEMVAQEVGSSINLAVGEELINSVIFSATLLLDDLMKEQGNKLESILLDLDQKKLIEDLQIGVESDCFTKKADNDDAFDNWKCFPQPLLLDKAFASVNSDALVQQIISQKPKIPLLIRTHLNPYSPPVVRLNWGAPLEDSSLMSILLEIDLGSSLMEFFEEELDTTSGDLGTGTGVIKDWCDDDRANSEKIKMNPAKCQAGDILPIMSFNTTGKLTLELNLSAESDVLVVSGGLASKIVSEPKKDDQGNFIKDKKGKIIKIPVVKLDESKSFLKLNTVENNTLTSNSALSGDVSGRINDMVLTQYVAGADLGEAQEEVRFRIPLMAPVLKGKGSFCEAHPKDAICECDKPEKKNDLECKLITQVDDLIDSLGIKKYGFGGGSIEELLLSITPEEFGAPRYLMLGIVPDLLYANSSNGLGTTEGPLTVKPKLDPDKADQWKPEQEWEPEEYEEEAPWDMEPEEKPWEDKTPWWKWW